MLRITRCATSLSWSRKRFRTATLNMLKGVGPDPRCYRVNFDKLGQVFPSFAARWSAQEGVRECYQAYRRYGLNKDDYEGVRF